MELDRSNYSKYLPKINCIGIEKWLRNTLMRQQIQCLIKHFKDNRITEMYETRSPFIPVTIYFILKIS